MFRWTTLPEQRDFIYKRLQMCNECSKTIEQLSFDGEMKLSLKRSYQQFETLEREKRNF